ncbi:hypothetical protein [Haloarcula laminariae]|uniref:hypothetical protein n=1 Tax=Haloarcula laminariae TaxID=2961577 RepID=UPI0021C72460|nr:hypothetical protein [Halomicroarcula laminariae]
MSQRQVPCPDPFPGCGDGGGGDSGDGNGDGGDGGGVGDVDVNVDVPSVQDFIDDFIPKFLTKLVEDLKTQVFTESVLENPIEAGIDAFLEGLATGVQNAFRSFFRALITPLVETPSPKGDTVAGPLEIAFTGATNDPWSGLISNVYFEGIVGLALGLQFITLAAVGLRYKSMDPVVRKQVGRRVVMVFFAIFLWLPAASLATQFFDILARQIVFSGYDIDKVVNTLYSITEISVKNPGLLAILVLVGLYVYLKAIFIAIVRWILIILLTLCMPLVAAFWPLEVWPFNRFAGLAKQIAGAYPGALAGGIPAAVLFRISFETDAWGLPEGLTALASIATIFLAAKAQKEMIVRSSRTAVRVSEQTLGGAKQSVKKPAKASAAIGAGAATAGAGAVAGSGGALSAAGGFSALGNAAKGRIGRAAYGAMNLHRGLSNANFGGSNGSGASDPGPTAGPDPSDPGPENAIRTAPNPTSDPSGSRPPEPAGPPAQGRLPDTGRGSAAESDAPDLGDTVRYWDLLDEGTTVEDGSPPDDAAQVPSDVDSAAGQVDSADDDDPAAGAAPTTDAGDDGDSPATGGAANAKDLFATDDDVLGPDAYRPRDDSPNT